MYCKNICFILYITCSFLSFLPFIFSFFYLLSVISFQLVLTGGSDRLIESTASNSLAPHAYPSLSSSVLLHQSIFFPFIFSPLYSFAAAHLDCSP
ncbi:hypothetical protein GGI43DRAFT_392252 [Trichoderma evansii]